METFVLRSLWPLGGFFTSKVDRKFWAKIKSNKVRYSSRYGS